jgi:hypothetical protein
MGWCASSCALLEVKGNEKSIVVAMHENDMKLFPKFYKKANWIKFSTWVI